MRAGKPSFKDMLMNDLQRQISDRVNAFVEDVNRLARKAAMETLASALGGPSHGPSAGPSTGRGPGRPPGRPAGRPPASAALAAPTAYAAPALAAAPAAAAAPAQTRGRRARGKGQKRDPREIARIQSDLAAYIAANGGQRIEQIKVQMGLDTKDLVLPIKKLMDEKTIRSEGTRRATKYFPAGGGTPKKK